MRITLLKTPIKSQVESVPGLRDRVKVPRKRVRWRYLVMRSNHPGFKYGHRVFRWEILILKMGGHEIIIKKDEGLEWQETK